MKNEKNKNKKNVSIPLLPLRSTGLLEKHASGDSSSDMSFSEILYALFFQRNYEYEWRTKNWRSPTLFIVNCVEILAFSRFYGVRCYVAELAIAIY